MTEQTRATLATITIVAGLALIGYLAYLRIDGAGMAAVGIVVALVSWFTRAPERRDPPSGVSLVPIVAAGALLAALVACGCSGPSRAISVENISAVAQYEAMLTDCRAQGKRANSYDVYEACAERVDMQLCETSRLRCKDGGVQ
jgi:hypothetical protein